MHELEAELPRKMLAEYWRAVGSKQPTACAAEKCALPNERYLVASLCSLAETVRKDSSDREARLV